MKISTRMRIVKSNGMELYKLVPGITRFKFSDLSSDVKIKLRIFTEKNDATYRVHWVLYPIVNPLTSELNDNFVDLMPGLEYFETDFPVTCGQDQMCIFDNKSNKSIFIELKRS